MKLEYSNYRNHIGRLLKEVLEAADPYQLVSKALHYDQPQLTVHGRNIKFHSQAELVLLAVGKASTPMARAAAKTLRLDFKEIIVVRPEADRAVLPAGWTVFQAGHPLPTDQSLAAGRAVRSALGDLHAGDLIILLLSGGGSALLEVPKPDIELQDLRKVNEDLLRSGAPIDEINVVRKSMSLIKGGGLARMSAPASVVSLILSDVVGDDLGMVASGPTVIERSDASRAREILQSYGLWERYPERIQAGIMSEINAQDAAVPPVNILLANNQTVTNAAARKAAQLGFVVEVLSEPLSGEARTAGDRFARRLRSLAAARPHDDLCLIQGGETTVTVRGAGLGGRNQEFAVAAAQALGNEGQNVILSFATDGVDGPTDAAGAIVDSQFAHRAKSLGLDPQSYLDANDVFTLLDRLGALIRTGPTQTNLNDIALGFSYSSR
jgi:hydroxypyruvate reductase